MHNQKQHFFIFFITICSPYRIDISNTNVIMLFVRKTFQKRGDLTMAKTTDMTRGSASKSIILFALPLLIGNLFQQLYNVVDSTVVGKFVGAGALAAVGATSSCSMLLLTLANGLSAGAGIIIAQCIGARDFKQMRKAVTALVYIGLIMGALITFAGIFLAEPILRLMNTPPDIINDSAVYMKINFAGTIGTLAYNSGAVILRSFGDSKTSLYILILSSIVNAALDLLFVLGFGMGVAGAAYATVTATFVSAAACIGYLYYRRHILFLSGLTMKFDKGMFREIVKTGIPSGLQSSMISIGNMCVQGLINSFGTMTVAAYTAAGKIDTIVIQIVMSIAMSLSVYSGQNVGAGNIERVRIGLRQTLKIMLTVCTAIAVLVIVFKRNLLCIFLSESDAAEAISIGCSYLNIIGIAYIICGAMQSFQNLIKGAGDVNTAMAAGFVELSTRIAASYALVHFFGVTGLWLAIPVSWGSACMIPLLRYLSGKWITKRSAVLGTAKS